MQRAHRLRAVGPETEPLRGRLHLHPAGDRWTARLRGRHLATRVGGSEGGSRLKVTPMEVELAAKRYLDCSNRVNGLDVAHWMRMLAGLRCVASGVAKT